MSFLKIFLFGGIRITLADQEPPAKFTQLVQKVLAYLVLHRHRIYPRTSLIGLFWGDASEERAQRCLSTAIWRLRQILEPQGITRGTYLLTTPAGEVGFRQESEYWLDVAEFEGQIARVMGKPLDSMGATEATSLETALTLHTGALLEGLYDNWALRERERHLSLYLKALFRLMRYKKNIGAHDEGLACGQRILDQDPLREEIHREMMRLYLASGQRTLAIRQYQTCYDILVRELSVPPMEETQLLYQEILKTAERERFLSPPGRSLDPRPGDSQVTHREDPPLPGEHSPLTQIITHFYGLARQMEKTQQSLHRAIKACETMLCESHFKKNP